jgi:hypothetical protein
MLSGPATVNLELVMRDCVFYLVRGRSEVLAMLSEVFRLPPTVLV